MIFNVFYKIFAIPNSQSSDSPAPSYKEKNFNIKGHIKGNYLEAITNNANFMSNTY
jgi:hypothetical protein